MYSFASPTQYHRIVVKQGDDHPILFQVPDTNGNPLDCSGWTIRAAVADSQGNVLYKWSTELGNAEGGPDGVALFTDESETWEWTRAHFDVLAISPEGVQRVPAEGVIQVKRLWSR